MIITISTIAALMFSIVAAEADEWPLQITDPGFFVAEITGREGRLFARDPQGRWRQLSVTPQGVTALPGAPARQVLPQGALPDGTVATGNGTIRRAWLAGPTGRYPHGVLGDAIEAGELAVQTGDGRRLTYKLDNQSVFEDLAPRIAVLDAKGGERVLVVRSYLDAGGALAIFGVQDGELALVAETPAIGQPNRWLNPAGVADFDGDGRTEFAIVVTPHIGGMLQLWRLTGDRLEKVGEIFGFSNHIIGSRLLELSAVGDFTGDGVADLALPSADRTQLRIVAFNRPSMLAGEIALPSRISGGVVASGGAIVAGLENGRLAMVRHSAP